MTSCRSSLHIAIQYSSLDVLKVLLKYGVDPNEPSAIHSKSRRSSQYGSSEAPSPTIPAILLPGFQHAEPRQAPPIPTLSQPIPTLSPPIPTQPPQEHQFYLDDARTDTDSSQSRQRLSINTPTSTSFKHSRRCSDWPSLISVGGNSRTPGVGRSCHYNQHLPEIVETSVENGFNFSAHYSKDDLMNLPCLYLAVVDGNPYVVQLLLRYGAQPNVQDTHGCSPLHLACCQEYFNLENIRSLLKYGGRVHLKNVNQDTPFSLYPDIVNEQRGVVRAALTRLTLPQPGKPRSRTSTVTSQNIRDYPLPPTPSHDPSTSGRSGSVSRFFKRLSSDPRPRGRDRRITRDESSTFVSEALRERTYSIGSCKSRHYSTCVQEDMESDISLVSSWMSYMSSRLTCHHVIMSSCLDVIHIIISYMSSCHVTNANLVILSSSHTCHSC